jgi:hypothetical protein
LDISDYGEIYCETLLSTIKNKYKNGEYSVVITPKKLEIIVFFETEFKHLFFEIPKIFNQNSAKYNMIICRMEDREKLHEVLCALI